MKKFFLAPVQQIEFLGLEILQKLNYFFLKVRQRDCSDDLKSNERQFDFKEFDRVTWEIDFHNSRNFISETSDSLPETDTNTNPEKNMTNEPVITLDKPSKEQLSWWITKKKIYNGKSLLIIPPDLTICSDALKTYCGASCQGIITGV